VTSLELVRQRGGTPGSPSLTADLKKAREAADRKDTAEASRIAQQLIREVEVVR